MDLVTKYAKLVLADKIISGKTLKKTAKRHLDDLKRSKTKAYPYYFDEAEAERIQAFAYRFCCHSKGKWAGQPVELSDWQIFFLGSVLGWKKKSNHKRRFKYFYVQVGKKNGKSTLMAVLGLYMLICDGEGGAEIYSAATTRDQAKIIFTEAKRMAEKSPQIRQLLTINNLNISLDRAASFFRPLSSDAQTLDGLNTHCALIDELHAHKTSDVYDNLVSSIVAREQPIIGVITTAGLNPQCFCKERYDFYKNVLDGTAESEETFIYIAELDEEDDWRDEHVWAKANPNMGISVFEEHLRTECNIAKEILSQQNSFKCKNLNMWVSDTTSWADMEKYNTTPDRVRIEDLEGRMCYIGCDLATRNDLASVVVEFPLDYEDGGKENARPFALHRVTEGSQDDGEGKILRFAQDDRMGTQDDRMGTQDDKGRRGRHYAVLHHSFMPYDRVWELSKEHNINYQAYIEAGYITATPGSIVDFDYIEQYIYELYKKYDVLETCIDPWSASQLEKNLLNNGIKVVEVRQGFFTLSEPTKDMEGAIAEQRLTHFNDPVLKWAVGNVVLTSDENDNVRPNKKKSRFKIDPAMALVIAHTRAYTHDENYPDGNAAMDEYYEQMKEQYNLHI